VWAVDDDQLEQVAGPVRSEHQEAEWVLADFFDDECVRDSVIDVGVVDVVAVCRRQNLHTAIS